MKATKRMQNRIEELAKKHGVDIYQAEAHFKLEKKGYMPLVVENIGQNCISVAHYYTQEGDMIADPDVVFFYGYKESGMGWVPIEITQPAMHIVGMGTLGGYKKVAFLDETENWIGKFYPKQQADLNTFCNTWASNIKAQGWLESGVKVS